VYKDSSSTNSINFGTSSQNPVIFKDSGTNPYDFTGGLGTLAPNNGSSSENFDFKFKNLKASNILWYFTI